VASRSFIVSLWSHKNCDIEQAQCPIANQLNDLRTSSFADTAKWMNNVKCVSEGKIGARGAGVVSDVSELMDQWLISSFQIGTVERVKNVKRLQLTETRSSKLTSLTGRPGMSCESKALLAVTRVKLGRHVSSNGNLHMSSDVKETHVRLGWLFKNFRSGSSKGKRMESESSLKVHPSSRVGDSKYLKSRHNLRRDDMFRRASASDGRS
jgi:hypothetical protein